MDVEEKEISYKTSNSYSILNSPDPKTKTAWFVCHGMGYLSAYFIKYFKDLDSNNNYIVAPQAPSKYYIQPKMYVGANWLTKENTLHDTENIMTYFDAVFEVEKLLNYPRLIVLGYSQGVSVALRYVARKKIDCNHIVIHSGGIPKELKPKDFSHLSSTTQIHLVYGTEDEYLDPKRIEIETLRAQELFGNKLSIHPFEGKHEVHTDFINQLL